MFYKVMLLIIIYLSLYLIEFCFFFPPNRTLLEEYCYACETLGGNKIEINKLNDKVKDIVQTLERRSV